MRGLAEAYGAELRRVLEHCLEAVKQGEALALTELHLRVLRAELFYGYAESRLCDLLNRKAERALTQEGNTLDVSDAAEVAAAVGNR